MCCLSPRVADRLRTSFLPLSLCPIVWVAISIGAASSACASIINSDVFINELHYDNSGRDVLEFVEVVLPEQIADLANYSLTLYNGSSGRAYQGPMGLDALTDMGIQQGRRFLVWDIALQNGAPDGLALARGNQVLQLLSYEGTFLASDGIAAGLTSTDLGVLEAPDTPAGLSLQLAGQGTHYHDFLWQPPDAHTRGAVNQQQGFTTPAGPDSVPEPGSWLIWATIAASAFWCLRSRA